jgi:hypothetical protein
MLLPFAFLIEFNQEQRLILNSCKEVVISYEVEDFRPPQAQEVGQGFSRLAIGQVQLSKTFK